MSKLLQTTLKRGLRPATSDPSPMNVRLQRKCGCAASSAPESCADCQSSSLDLQRRPTDVARPDNATSTGEPSVVHQVLRAPGHSLSDPVLQMMEPRFGHDFSRVRIHTGAAASDSAAAVNARAYTVGEHIVFGEGAYSPHSTDGQRTLAHELAHTIQQGSNIQRIPDHLEVTDPDSASEREAEAAASRVMEGDTALPELNVGPKIARDPPRGQSPAPAPAPACANPGVQRTLEVQPVFFQSSATDPAPTGATWPQRLLTAQLIWEKLGVDIVASAPTTLTDATNKSAGGNRAERDTVRALVDGPGIEVFMLDNDLADAGGGGTIAAGDASKVALSDRGSSDTLLAHELGHILLGSPNHPPTVGDPGTVMEPSGDNNTNNPLRNTMANFNAIVFPAGTASICINPDP